MSPTRVELHPVVPSDVVLESRPRLVLWWDFDAGSFISILFWSRLAGHFSRGFLHYIVLLRVFFWFPIYGVETGVTRGYGNSWLVTNSYDDDRAVSTIQT